MTAIKIRIAFYRISFSARMKEESALNGSCSTKENELILA